MTTKPYKVLSEGDIYGVYRHPNEIVFYADDQVKYLIAPHGERLEAVPAGSLDQPRPAKTKKSAPPQEPDAVTGDGE